MRWLPETLLGRTIAVLLIGFTASTLIAFSVYWDDRTEALSGARGHQVAEHIATVVRLAETSNPLGRRHMARSLSRPGLRVFWSAHSFLPEGKFESWRVGSSRKVLLEHLGPEMNDRIRLAFGHGISNIRGGFRGGIMRHGPRDRPWPGGADAMEQHMRAMAAPWFSGRSLGVSIQLQDDTWLNFWTQFNPAPPFWASRILHSIIVITLIVIVLSVWAVRKAIAPLSVLAAAAERLGVDMNAPPLPEEGPREIRRAATAFNQMQQRLRSFVDDRTKMLAAISHDLRTPITRLKLRAEMVDDDMERDKILADLDEMESMISATLSFARDESTHEARKSLDLAALVRGVVDAAVDAGGDAEFEGPDHLVFDGRPVVLKRAIGNLIDNAIKYGNHARVSLKDKEGSIYLTVEDGGPGIPPSELEKVFSPFYRIEPSRSRDTGGVGLGLAVVRSIVRGNGGDIKLENIPGGGLRATVILPLKAKD